MLPSEEAEELACLALAAMDSEPRLYIKERPRKKVDRCDVCTEGARGGCGTCIFNGNFE